MKKEWTILTEGYHGHMDLFQAINPPHRGVPKDNSIEKLKKDLDEDQIKKATAVIIEPIITDISQKRIDWLRRLRDICTKHETLLIFDEIVTGFRTPKFCMARHLHVEPDILIIGGAMANGFPLAAVLGKTEVMNSDYFVSSTYAGDIISLTAMKKTIRILKDDISLDRLWNEGGSFVKQFNDINPTIIKIIGYNTRGSFLGTPLNKALFMQEAVLAGIFFGYSWFFSFPLIDVTKQVIDTCKSIIQRITLGDIKLKGKLPRSPNSLEVRKNAES